MKQPPRRRRSTATPPSWPPNMDWDPARTRPLRGQVAVVAGATRGGGRGIAVSLGLAGATVYVTGRSVPGHPATAGRPETIHETAQMIRAAGGVAVPVRVDHTNEPEVRRLFARVAREQHGHLDILVNDVWGGDELTEWGRPPWTMSWALGRAMLERGIFSHLLTVLHGVPLLVRRRRGLVFEVTDGDHQYYRGSLFYDLVKVSAIRIAFALHEEFREARLSRVSALAVTPGFLRSEAMLDRFGVTEETWKDGVARAPHFYASETPYYLGRAVVALASDPRVHARSGQVLGTWDLARQYGFTDRNGTRPNWGKLFYGEIAKDADPPPGFH
jgi:NAD(P)-dependent dehydrogenase (short-subunit alcohol dehydrogenase family)